MIKKSLNIILALYLDLFACCSAAFAWHIPETGQELCFDNSAPIPCPAQTDAFFGQDASYSFNPLSYTKLDEEGRELPQDAASWAMVRDNVTGLVWEVKGVGDGETNYADPHDPDNHYSWYDDNSATNGGYAGTGGPEPTTKDFITYLNQVRFGGFEDWRMPSVLEIASIVHYGKYSPCIDDAFFPNMKQAGYWSSTTEVSDPQKAWRLDFSTGTDESFSKANRYYAIAVRGGRSGGALVVNGDGTVTDTSSWLVWAQHPAKDTSGNPLPMTWQEALSYCESSMLAGFPDWRLPTVKELLSLADYSRQNPVIDEAAFPGTPSSLFWTSTTSSADPSASWHVDFGSGGSAYWIGKGASLYVRAVRGGKAPQPDTGSLVVFVEPTEALDSGGGWRRVGSSVWLENGTLEQNLPVGQYVVEFKEAAGWVKPTTISVPVLKDEIAQATGTYVRIPYKTLYVSKDYPVCGGKSPCYGEIPKAMAESGGAKHIKINKGHYSDSILASKNEALLLQGGFDSAFSAVVSFSSIEQVIITDGKVIIENIQIGNSSSASQAASVAIPSRSAASFETVQAVKVQGLGAFDKYLNLARPGSPEEAMLAGLSREAQAVFDGPCIRDQGMLSEVLVHLYQRVLERLPEPWALEMWDCYGTYLTSKLGLEESQVIWGIACHLFESNEYAQRNRDASQSLDELFLSLLLRFPTDSEREAWLTGDWTFRQAVLGVTKVLQLNTINGGNKDAGEGVSYSAAIADSYMGLLDRYPTVEEMRKALSAVAPGSDLGEIKRRVYDDILSSNEFKALETCSHGARLRLGLTIGISGFDGYHVLPIELE